VGYKATSMVEGVLAIDGVLHNVRCKVYTIIDRIIYLLIPKWDILMNHEGKRKAKKDLLKIIIKKSECIT